MRGDECGELCAGIQRVRRAPRNTTRVHTRAHTLVASARRANHVGMRRRQCTARLCQHVMSRVVIVLCLRAASLWRGVQGIVWRQALPRVHGHATDESRKSIARRPAENAFWMRVSLLQLQNNLCRQGCFATASGTD